MATCWACSGGMLPAPLAGSAPHRYTEPPAQSGEVTSLQMVGVRSQFGLLRGCRLSLGMFSGCVALGRCLTSLGLSHHTGLYFSTGRIRKCVMSDKAGPPIKRKLLFWGKEIDI